MTTAELNAIKEKMKSEIFNRDSVTADTTKIVVSMAEFGVKAGADQVMMAMVEELGKREIADVKVIADGYVEETGNEPVVTVIAPGKEKVVYGKVNTEIAKKIISEHIVKGKVLKENVIG